MDQLGIPVQLSIAAGAVALALAVFTFLVRQIKDLVPLFKPSSRQEDTDMGKKVDSILAQLDIVDLVRIERQVERIYQIVTATDRDGVPMVYVQVSLYEAIDRMTTILERNTAILEMLSTQHKDDDIRG
jgi:predicted CoA-binding protein